MISNNFPVYLKQLLPKLRDVNPHVRVLGYLVANALLGQLSGDQQIDAANRMLDVMKSENLSSTDDLPLDKVDILDVCELASSMKVILSDPLARP